jgi:hypothetical protein
MVLQNSGTFQPEIKPSKNRLQELALISCRIAVVKLTDFLVAQTVRYRD